VPYAEFADPQSLNLYTYVRNVPTTRYDADGHEVIDLRAVYQTLSKITWQQTKDTAAGIGKAAINAVTKTVNAVNSMAGSSVGGSAGEVVDIPQFHASNSTQQNAMTGTNITIAVASLALPGPKGAGAVEGGAAETTNLSKVDSIIKTIDESGFNVTANAKTAAQEGNVTITNPSEPGVKLNLRTETHPLEPGGQPVKHVNVERVEPGPKNRPEVKSNTHIDQ